MDRYFLIVLDDLELRMLHAEPLTAQLRLPENDQPLAAHDHFLHVVDVEPAEHERLTERVRLALLERDLEDFFPATETFDLRFSDLAAKTERLLALLAREADELAPILVPAREVMQ